MKIIRLTTPDQLKITLRYSVSGRARSVVNCCQIASLVRIKRPRFFTSKDGSRRFKAAQDKIARRQKCCSNRSRTACHLALSTMTFRFFAHAVHTVYFYHCPLLSTVHSFVAMRTLSGMHRMSGSCSTWLVAAALLLQRLLTGYQPISTLYSPSHYVWQL